MTKGLLLGGGSDSGTNKPNGSKPVYTSEVLQFKAVCNAIDAMINKSRVVNSQNSLDENPMS